MYTLHLSSTKIRNFKLLKVKLPIVNTHTTYSYSTMYSTVFTQMQMQSVYSCSTCIEGLF